MEHTNDSREENLNQDNKEQIPFENEHPQEVHETQEGN